MFQLCTVKILLYKNFISTHKSVFYDCREIARLNFLPFRLQLTQKYRLILNRKIERYKFLGNICDPYLIDISSSISNRILECYRE